MNHSVIIGNGGIIKWRSHLEEEMAVVFSDIRRCSLVVNLRWESANFYVEGWRITIFMCVGWSPDNRYVSGCG